MTIKYSFKENFTMKTLIKTANYFIGKEYDIPDCMINDEELFISLVFDNTYIHIDLKNITIEGLNVEESGLLYKKILELKGEKSK